MKITEQIKKHYKPIAITAASVILIGSAAYLSLGKDKVTIFNRKNVVATVNKKPIMKAAYDEQYKVLIKQIDSMKLDDKTKAKYKESIGPQIVARLVDSEIQTQQYDKTHKNKDELKKAVDAKMDMMLKSYNNDKKKLEEDMIKNGTSYDIFLRDTEKQTKIDKLMSEIKIEVKEDEIKKYYDEHNLYYPEGNPKIAYKQIIVNDEKVANEIMTQLGKGGSFDELAKKYSIDETTKNKGGEHESAEFMTVQYDVLKDLVKLKPNEVTEPVKMGTNFVISKLIKIDNYTVKKYDTVKDSIKSTLEGQTRMTEYIKLKDKWKKEAVIDTKSYEKNIK